MVYDKIIIGAGLYGLYSALYCGRRGQKVLLLEYDDAPFKRATYINQARVHMGYHYPRSYSTAIKSAGYFERFNSDFKECINSDFEKIYAVSSTFSWTNAEQFSRFCEYSNIPCETLSCEKYFNPGLCDGTFLTKEYTYDSYILLKILMASISKLDNIVIEYNCRITAINQHQDNYEVVLSSGKKAYTDFLVNTTYASVNQVLDKLNYPPFKIKYEICEIILCLVTDNLKRLGITVMDGPFFSIMPFGKTGLHSLTSVTFTPHKTNFDDLPSFDCQNLSDGFCSPSQLGNCNDCIARPETSWDYMSSLAKKYLRSEFGFDYQKSLFSMKPILKASEVDDSRPTVIKEFSSSPKFISVLSGKINTIYDLEEIL